jgi:hypothetical protein
VGKALSSDFENVKNQIGFCGIYCGGCAAGNGAIAEQARRLLNTVEAYEHEKWVVRDFDFKEFMKGLNAIKNASTCPGCRKGGGPATCKVRICGMQKNLSNCGECKQLIPCRDFEHLEKSHPSMKKQLMDNAGKSQEQLIMQWRNELKAKWPHCLLFCESSSE